MISIIKEKIWLHIYMWHDLQTERLQWTQFSKVSQWYHRRKELNYTLTCDVTYTLKDWETQFSNNGIIK